MTSASIMMRDDGTGPVQQGDTQDASKGHASGAEQGPSTLGGTLVLLAAAGILTLISRAVDRGDTQPADERIHETLQAHRSSVGDAVVRPITLLSLPVLVVAATASLVYWLHRQGRNEAAIAIGSAPVAAATLGQTFTMFFEQRNPPDNQNPSSEKEAEASFPSGHTAGVTAEALAVSYILNREGIISPPVLAMVLGWPLVVGVSRLYRDRHWTSDVVAGWVAGTAVAAGSAVLYDTLKARNSTVS